MCAYEADRELLSLIDRATVARGYLHLLTTGFQRLSANQRTAYARRVDEAVAEIAGMARDRARMASRLGS